MSQEFGNQGNSFGLILWGSTIKRKSLFIVFFLRRFPSLRSGRYVRCSATAPFLHFVSIRTRMSVMWIRSEFRLTPKVETQECARTHIFRTAMDGSGSTQQRVRIANSKPKNVQGRTFQNCHGWQWFHAKASSHCELVAQGCTGRTSLGAAPITNLGTASVESIWGVMCYCTGILDNTYKILYTLRRVEGGYPVAPIHSKYTVHFVLSMLSFTGVDYIIL